MRSRTEAVLAGLVVLSLAGGCADPAVDRVTLVGASPVPLVSGVTPPASAPVPLVSGVTPPSSLPPTTPAPMPPLVLASSLAEPVATGTPLVATGPPRFFVTARTPVFHDVPGTKTATATPVRAVVNDAATGAYVADVPLPPGVASSWHLVAAAPDNRTFALAGWTGLGRSLRFYRVRLDENGKPGEPELVPDAEPEPDQATAIALSQDGTKLAYVSTPIGGGAKVAVLDLATGRRRDWLTRGPMMVMGLAWAPDGRRLALAAIGRGLHLLDLTAPGSDLSGVSRQVRPLTGVSVTDSVAFTPDGRSLVYSKGHAIERVPLDGGEPQVLARPAVPRGASLGLRFALDGTGRHLLYTHDWRAHRVDLADGSATSVPIEADERPGEGESPAAAW